ncbi:MAG: hypothetical protein F6K03_05540 [Kamptonema sp. SIO4C4]|nr:hypothetical protein [Kamptonema sp. SIO4C4]
MKVKVTEQGALIPKELLGDSQEVEIKQEAGKIIIIPKSEQQKAQNSIWELGKKPVDCDVTDGAIQHDFYLYN